MIYRSRWSVALLFALLAGMGGGLCREVRAVNLPPIWRWSNPTPIGADIYAMNYSGGTFVEVGELGQAFVSSDLQTWIPVDTSTTNALRAMTYLGGRLVVTGEAGTVLFSDDLANFINASVVTTNWLEGVAASSSLLVAVGDNAAIYTSHDAVTWTPQTAGFSAWLTGVAYGSNTFVAVGQNGFVATSTNGVNWKQSRAVTSVNLNGVSWVGNKFVAIGERGMVIESVKGDLWSSDNIGLTNSLYAVTQGGGYRVVAGESGIFAKQLPGGSWVNQSSSAVTNPAPVWSYYATAWTGNPTNGFLAVGHSGLSEISTRFGGQLAWSSIGGNSPRGWLWQVARTPDNYLAVGNYGSILSSPDGVTWTPELVPPVATNEVLLGVGGSTNYFLAVGTQGTMLWATNAYLWNGFPPLTTNDLAGVFYDGLQYWVMGNNGTLLVSKDGANFSLAPVPTTAFLTSMTIAPSGWVVVGADGWILSTTNATTWTAGQAGTNWLSQVAYLNGVLIAVGENGTILTSGDGKQWTSHSSGTSAWLNGIDYLGGIWLAVGNGGTMVGSVDTTNWVVFPSITSKSLFGITHNGGQLVTVGEEGAILRSPLIPPSTPVNITNFSTASGQEVFLFNGVTDQTFFLDSSTNLPAWVQGPLFQIYDASGTLLYTQPAQTNNSPEQYYRTSTPQ